MRRFEVSAVAFLAFNTLFAFLALREQRSLLIYCQDWTRQAGDGSDCLEPYNFLWLEALVALWILGALFLGGLALAHYVRAKQSLRDPQEV
jgi:hypothetical protein